VTNLINVASNKHGTMAHSLLMWFVASKSHCPIHSINLFIAHNFWQYATNSKTPT